MVYMVLGLNDLLLFTPLFTKYVKFCLLPIPLKTIVLLIVPCISVANQSRTFNLFDSGQDPTESPVLESPSGRVINAS